MALFEDKITSADQLLAEPAIVRLLRYLANNTTCLTVGQAHQILRPGAPASRSHHYHELVRDILHRLEKLDYIGTASVERLPPATTRSSPLIRLFRTRDPEGGERPLEIEFEETPVLSSLVNLSGIDSYVRLARERVPAIEAHRPAKFCFATKTAVERFNEENASRSGVHLPGKKNTDDIETVARRIIKEHRSFENQGWPAEGLVRSHLTAIFNLNQFMLADGIRTKCADNQWDFHAVRSWERDGEIRDSRVKRTTLVFVHPCDRSELISKIECWWESTSSLPEIWWL